MQANYFLIFRFRYRRIKTRSMIQSPLDAKSVLKLSRIPRIYSHSLPRLHQSMRNIVMYTSSPKISLRTKAVFGIFIIPARILIIGHNPVNKNRLSITDTIACFRNTGSNVRNCREYTSFRSPIWQKNSFPNRYEIPYPIISQSIHPINPERNSGTISKYHCE